MIVVCACHVLMLGAFAAAERGGIAPVQRSVGEHGNAALVTWVAPMAPEIWMTSRLVRNDATIVPSPVSATSLPALLGASASPAAPPAASRTASAISTPVHFAATPVLEKALPDDGFESRNAATFVAADTLDQRPVAVSAPDIGHLGAASVSGLPVVLRVFVSQSGQVVRVDVITASDDDTAFVAALDAMLKGTLFLPGKRNGADVAAFFDVKLHAIEYAPLPQ